MAQFVAIPALTLENYLRSLSFERTVQGQELVYIRRSAVNPNVLVKVYTSIRVDQSQVRAAGRDAIRVCCVFDNGSRSFGIGKFQPIMRVHSVESVLERLFDRLKQATARAREWMAQDGARTPVPSRPRQDQVYFLAKPAPAPSVVDFSDEDEFGNDSEHYEIEAERRMSCPDGCC